MRKYHTQEEVPWRDILGIIHWKQEISLYQVQRTMQMGFPVENSGDLRNLRISCECSKTLRRFLGNRETKLDRQAEELLKRLEP